MRAMIAALICVLVGTCAAGAAGQRTSKNDERLKRILKRFPDADANGDGVLTDPEMRTHRKKYFAERSQEGGRGGEVSPDRRDVSYGPHPRHVLDFYQAKSEQPTPVFVWLHGGGFVHGDKRGWGRGALVRELASAGISSVSANYPFTRGENAACYPAQMHAGARVVQFLRSNAKEWQIDPKRIGIGGGSAGAVIGQWVAFHDDLAAPDNEDPVARQSSRVTCLYTVNGPCTNDPHFQRILGGREGLHPGLRPLFGVKTFEALETPEMRRKVEDSSPINHVTPDDPPTFLFYKGPMTPTPLPKDKADIHHPLFGKVLKEKLDEAGVECHFYYKGKAARAHAELEFLKEHLLRGQKDDSRQFSLYTRVTEKTVAPSTRIRATHYSAMKALFQPGDIAYMTCTRGVDPRERRRPAAKTGRARPTARFIERKFQAAVAALNAIDDPKVGKAVVFSSIEDLEENLPRLPKDLTWVTYNSEPHMTPDEELAHIEESVKRFAQIAREAGLKVGWGPTGRMIRSDEDRYLSLAAWVDLIGLQHQKVLQFSGVEAFIGLTRQRAMRIRQINPRCKVLVQVVIRRGTDKQLIQALKAVAPDIDAFGIFTMREPQRAAGILKAVRGSRAEDRDKK